MTTVLNYVDLKSSDLHEYLFIAGTCDARRTFAPMHIVQSSLWNHAGFSVTGHILAASHAVEIRHDNLSGILVQVMACIPPTLVPSQDLLLTRRADRPAVYTNEFVHEGLVARSEILIFNQDLPHGPTFDTADDGRNLVYTYPSPLPIGELAIESRYAPKNAAPPLTILGFTGSETGFTIESVHTYPVETLAIVSRLTLVSRSISR